MMLTHTCPAAYYSPIHQPPHLHRQQQQQQHHRRRPEQHPSHQQPEFQHFQQANFAASSQPSFSTASDNIPAATAAVAAATVRFNQTRPAASNAQGLNSMPSDSWISHGQHPPRQTQRFGHQRDSSLSSVGSNTPVSPYNANTTNPRIAVNEAVGDSLHDMTGVSDNYTFDVTKTMDLSGSFYANGLGSFHGHGGGGIDGHTIIRDINAADALPALIGTQQRQGGLAPTSDMSVTGPATKSRPVSVASSIGGDEPATPSFQEHEDEHRRTKNGEGPDSPVLFHLDSDPVYFDDCLLFRPEDIAFAVGANMPKLSRTITDVYTDELYNPNFTITSASPSPHSRPAPSPNRDIFSQRINAANSQHLYAPQSPMIGDSRGHSPFRQGSPYASAVNEVPKSGLNRPHVESPQQLRERRKVEEDVKQLQQHVQRQQNNPPTISPKDCSIEYSAPEVDADFPLFPDAGAYGSGQSNGAGNMIGVTSQQPASPFPSMSTTPVHANFSFSMTPHIQIPQDYPFVTRQMPQQDQQRRQQPPTPASAFSRMSSVEAGNMDSDSGNDGQIRRPDRTAADSGTYTCTYHGCTLRFETPAFLQKHKREAHRQVNALNHLRSEANMENSMTSSQAGPHKCDRINPSTGKPCNAIFSRPYDLTRHEDTIHNARKQKVRCDFCTEEKTFSRADALTRHYRVCHPEITVTGKHRKRGGAMGA
ncbi:putative 26s proteasome regulatory subunit-like protein [Rosellinia necatrix]|uniref:Putative 26s proteasome regulatory subunit-like protein n=1 Tax=Rosellinia necatrix TaxID=77044 RepID=A0A1W2TUC0_ROSNE|nr:putative 26s proteasome regulatory subunit-like protein [Rosellinia necatrix]